jgi:ATP-binding cassette subfamily B protein
MTDSHGEHPELPMEQALRPLWWPLARLGEGLEALARASGLAPQAVAELRPPAHLATDLGLATRWLDWAAARLGLEVEPVDTTVPDVEALLQSAGPALLPWADADGGMGFLLLLQSRHGAARLIGPDLRVRRCALSLLRGALTWRHEAPLLPEVESLLRQADVPRRREAAVRCALLRDRLAGVRITPWWLVRLPASAPTRAQAWQARLPQQLASMVLVFALLYALEIGAWALMGEGVLSGRLDLGWLAAWLLLLATTLPLQIWGSRLNAVFALRVASLLKARLLAGALRMDVDQVRRQGVGALLGRVIESQALESLVVGGGLSILVAMIELCFAAGVLSLGAAAGPHLAVLAVWFAMTVALCSRFGRRLKVWTLSRLAMTHELIEQMVGHRTRLAQERTGRRDAQEDAALQGYLHDAQALDRAALPLQAGLASAWILVALAVLVPAFVAGSAGAEALAISLGGILLAQRALAGIAGGLSSLMRAGIAWQQVGELFRAGGHDPSRVPPAFVDAEGRGAAQGPLVDAQDLRYAHAASPPALRGLDLRIAPGEQVLLQGPSGGGKSTLAALLTGLRRPQSGLLLLQGLDAPTLGDQWGGLATAAPQFHENHVLSGTVAFNLLMGRQWPASVGVLPRLRAATCAGPAGDRTPLIASEEQATDRPQDTRLHGPEAGPFHENLELPAPR